MNANSTVYKGYKLIARVVRIPQDEAGGASRFRATVSVGLSSGDLQSAESYSIPLYDAGGFASSPRVAVDAAIRHGRYLVDHSLRSWA
ncbi:MULTISPECIES: hypothetical protein [unclassified Achromobacter]|uniref:hypothetical protein n=1 Tax=unclassified Achromobacter TaxID=2626865 RepID=UPI00069EFE79|nr:MULTISPECIES: hypothetical protein [unclassified Achromobacter]KOF52255.1 hypothetical protein AD428_21440 [Achromobacter sp. DMS1]